MDKKLAIAVYDSGVGGIPTLLTMRERLPFEHYIYFADNMNMPYGDKTCDELTTIAEKNVLYLKERFGIKMLILACNTLTASSVKTLRASFPDIIIIGTEPNIKQGIKRLKEGEKALVLVTASTKKNLNFNEKFPNKKQYDVLALPRLASDIENELPRDVIFDCLSRELSPLKNKYKSLVLGCTHYHYVKEPLAKILGVPIYDSIWGVVSQAERKLIESDSATERKNKGALTLIFTNPSPQILKKYIKYVK